MPERADQLRWRMRTNEAGPGSLRWLREALQRGTALPRGPVCSLLRWWADQLCRCLQGPSDGSTALRRLRPSLRRWPDLPGWIVCHHLRLPSPELLGRLQGHPQRPSQLRRLRTAMRRRTLLRKWLLRPALTTLTRQVAPSAWGVHTCRGAHPRQEGYLYVVLVMSHRSPRPTHLPECRRNIRSLPALGALSPRHHGGPEGHEERRHCPWERS